MEVSLQQVSRHFYYRWVFKDLTYRFSNPNWYSITGFNGSGKSTLLQVISGFLSPSKGKIFYSIDGQSISNDSFFSHLSLAAPYLDLIGEFSPQEHLEFHKTFKPLKTGFTVQSILENTGLYEHRNKAIRFFSSGMIQRLRLAQALYFDTSLLLLDEPTSHLDQQGVEWYQAMLAECCHYQCVIIASNNPADYEQCYFQIPIESYKPEISYGF